MMMIAIRRDTVVVANLITAVFIDQNAVFVQLRRGEQFSSESFDDIEEARTLMSYIVKAMENVE